jgi:hypothetical protein
MDTPSKAWALNQLHRRRQHCLRRALNLRHQQRPHALRDMMHQQNQQTRELIAHQRRKTL